MLSQSWGYVQGNIRLIVVGTLVGGGGFGVSDVVTIRARNTQGG